MGLRYGDVLVVDHINHDTLDNRKSNLRECGMIENSRNQQKERRNKTGFKGVFWHKASRKYQAGIGHKYGFVYLRLFDKKEDAALAYDMKAKELFGEFALLNNAGGVSSR
jgi:hypothetical protein